jgi:glycosyltransferase involved in cell wall biosynthesis
LVLIDDGSTDRSTPIAMGYAERYPGRVRYLEHESHQNLGKSTSRNVGIRHANGDYVTFLDADDMFLPEKLARQVPILEAHPEAVMVYGPTLYWYGWTGNPDDRARDFISKLGVQPGILFQAPTLLTRFLKDNGIVPCICGLLARRTILVETGGFEETIQHLYEDQVFLAKMCLAGPVYVDSSCGDRYRQHPASSSAVAIRTGTYHPLRPNASRHDYLDWLIGYVAERDIRDHALLKALKQALRPYRYPTLYRLVHPVGSLARRVKGFAEYLLQPAGSIRQ